MINVKISSLLNGTEALQKLAGADLKAKLAWQIARLLKAAEAELQSFNETRMTLIKKYGEKDTKGELITDEKGNCKILPENINTFTTELNELLNTEVEINVNKISIDDLENMSFTPSEMTLLEDFINFEE